MNARNEQITSQAKAAGQTHGDERRKKMMVATSGQPSIHSQFHSEKKRLAATNHAVKAAAAITPKLAQASLATLFTRQLWPVGRMPAMASEVASLGGKQTLRTGASLRRYRSC